MSGPKAADVRQKLNRAVDTAQRVAGEIQRNNEQLESLGSGDLNRSQNAAQNLQGQFNIAVTGTMEKYAPEGAAQLEDQKRNVDALMQSGNAALNRAQNLRNEARSLHNSAVNLLNDSVQLANSVANRISGNYYGGYLYQEDADAARARKNADRALQLEREASKKMRQALACNKTAKDAFDAVTSAGGRFRDSFENVKKIAEERETAAKIEEENHRKAVALRADINGITESINALNHRKFAPGELDSLSSDINKFQQHLDGRVFGRAVFVGESLVTRLRSLEQKVSSLQTAFEQAQISAQNSLKSAQDEAGLLNRAELVRWTDKEDEISAAFSQLDSASSLIKSENFADAEKQINSAMETLRSMSQTAEANKNGSEQRTFLAEVIMNALYEQGYDAPAFYYAIQKSDGSDVEFSEMTIFAKAPGDKGDMRMNIDLEGKVKLDVDGIADGDEAVCRKLIEDLQKGVGDEIDFTMTDWGRAANTNTQSKVGTRMQTKVQERTRERNNG